MIIKGMAGIFVGQEFKVNGSLVFGRSSQGCDVHFPDDTKGVSRTHCKVDSAGGNLTLTDMGSSYGTFLNGEKLEPNVPATLNPGDTFWLGDRTNSFTVSETANIDVTNVLSNTINIIKGDKKILIGIIVAVIIVLISAILLTHNNSGNDSLVGTWRVVEKPGIRMSFAENGDLYITQDGKCDSVGGVTDAITGNDLAQGIFEYSPAGDHTIGVKYTGPDVSGGANILVANFSVTGAYSKGYIWKYKYNNKDGVVEIYDMNNYKLWSLEKEN